MEFETEITLPVKVIYDSGPDGIEITKICRGYREIIDELSEIQIEVLYAQIESHLKKQAKDNPAGWRELHAMRSEE